MDHLDSDADATFRAQARAFLRAHAPAKGGPDDYHAAFKSGHIDQAEYVERAKAWQRLLADQGWAGITWPKQYGGGRGRPPPTPRSRGGAAGAGAPARGAPRRPRHGGHGLDRPARAAYR